MVGTEPSTTRPRPAAAPRRDPPSEASFRSNGTNAGGRAPGGRYLSTTIRLFSATAGRSTQKKSSAVAVPQAPGIVTRSQHEDLPPAPAVVAVGGALVEERIELTVDEVRPPDDPVQLLHDRVREQAAVDEGVDDPPCPLRKQLERHGIVDLAEAVQYGLVSWEGSGDFEDSASAGAHSTQRSTHPRPEDAEVLARVPKADVVPDVKETERSVEDHLQQLLRRGLRGRAASSPGRSPPPAGGPRGPPPPATAPGGDPAGRSLVGGDENNRVPE
ncbi:hypothetical protein THAOC_30145 [Thalassiosira oceanica]|uniref:Uncharacterized protein n=1 Tax=Thalassiosira oceanica TaxID=159749 RepID=K0RAR7_THAOC|nr:hypothetical protein THAOC_30145 [Thalassiosira oceanica]|eukprot:EJK50758.1 hypothetical protein THAOC_30145 [Thalassiosira oceanica]